MASIRIWHNHLGVFIAPSILFFSITGAWQLFSLHEAEGTYAPPAIIEKLSSVHKDQIFVRTKRDVERDSAAASTQQAGPSQPAPDDEEKTPIPTLLLKWFFLLVAVSLSVTTLLGLWMGLRHPARRRRAWWFLITGAIIPIVLAAI